MDETPPETTTSDSLSVDAIQDHAEEAFALLQRGLAADALRKYDELLSICGDRTTEELGADVASALLNKGVLLAEACRFEEALLSYEGLVERFGGPETLDRYAVYVATALVNEGLALNGIGRTREAWCAFDEAVTRFSASADIEVLEQVGIALDRIAVIYRAANRHTEAVAIYGKLVNILASSSDSGLVQQTASGLLNMADDLTDLGDVNQAFAVLERLVTDYSERRILSLDRLVAAARLRQGRLLGGMSRPMQQVEVYEWVFKTFSRSTDPALRDSVIDALISEARVFVDMAKKTDAIDAYERADKVAHLFDASHGASMATRVTLAKAAGLMALELYDEAIAEYSRLVSELATGKDGQELRGEVAGALIAGAKELASRKNYALGLQMIDMMDDWFECDKASALYVLAIDALGQKADWLGAMGRRYEALAAYDCVLARLAETDDGKWRGQMVHALYNRAQLLRNMGRSAEALIVCDGILERFEDSSDGYIAAVVVDAMLLTGILVSDVGDAERAISVYNKLLDRYSDIAEPERLARTLAFKASAFGALGELAGAIEIYDELIARYADATTVQLQLHVAQASYNRAARLEELGRDDEAWYGYRRVRHRFRGTESLDIKDVVMLAAAGEKRTSGR